MKRRLLPPLPALGLLCALLGAALLGPTRPALAEAVWIAATGQAHVTGPNDRDAARRRALGDALVSAALAGGASLRGISVLDRGTMTRDLSILRPTGRVLSHRLIRADLSDRGLWTVEIEAQVAPLAAGACGNGRGLVFSAYIPELRLSPEAPAWAASRAMNLAQQVIDTADRHPRVQLDRVLPAPVQGRNRPAGLDYMTVTAGRGAPAPGDHILAPAITLEGGQQVTLTLDLAITEPGQRVSRFRIARAVAAPRGHGLGVLTGQTRANAEAALTAGVLAEVTAILDRLGCAPPAARMALAGDALEVPLGQRHGLTRGSLAVIDDPNDSFGLLEITDLRAESARLRPLDPTRSAAGMAGLGVYFVETGF